MCEWGAVGCAAGACGRGGSGARQGQLRQGSNARQEQLRCRMLSVSMRIRGDFLCCLWPIEGTPGS